jgi:hypothetical protein
MKWSSQSTVHERQKPVEMPMVDKLLYVVVQITYTKERNTGLGIELVNHFSFFKKLCKMSRACMGKLFFVAASILSSK